MSRRWTGALRVALGIGVLGLVLLTIDLVATAGMLARADVALALAGVAGLTTVHLVPAAAWRLMLAIMAGYRLPWWRGVAAFYAAQAIGGVTPANVGGDVHRAVALRASGLGWSAAVAPVIVQRATSYAALAVLACLAVLVLAPITDLAGPLVTIGVSAAALVAFASWLALAPPSRLAGAGAWVVRRLGADEVQLEPAGGLRPAVTLGIASGLIFHAASIGFTLLLVLALDPAVPAVPALAAIAVARLSLAVPITPSGIGVQEGVLAVLFGSIGLAPQTAVAGLLLGRLALVLTTAIGAMIIVRGHRRVEADARPKAHPAVR
ncbi:MAG: flippase-like domain-containing protein [Chloroflexi bacterium]|nr:flippase-like domain-containing protein [Chloroflexota bacterium]